MVRIVARKTILHYAEVHTIAAPSLKYWLGIVREAKWQSMNDIALSFRHCKVLNGDRVRFEVAGGSHRMIVSFSFAGQTCWIKFLGTHSEYDSVDALTVAMF